LRPRHRALLKFGQNSDKIDARRLAELLRLLVEEAAEPRPPRGDALKLYCARHTFGSVAVSETRNPGLVKEVLGHESLDTTMGYLHPETAQIKLVIDRLNQQKCVM
jgi:integrase